MDYVTIGEVSSMFRISARMLRYYEKAGLIESARKEGYAYRVYDEEAVKRVRQIIILRKLQIPLKQISCMMTGSRDEAIRILEARIHDINESARSVGVIKTALERLLELLCEDVSARSYMDCMQEASVVALTEFLPLEKHHLKEEQKMSMGKELVEKESCVRIVLLPSCTVAAYQFIGDNPEENAGEVINAFVRFSGLYEKKPDARMFGFNHPDPKPGSDDHGYEIWVTIPDDMEVAGPLTKKNFDGGLYAAYTINYPDFHEWRFLAEWVKNNETYRADYHDREMCDMSGCLEEHLNWVYSSHMGWSENGIDGKIDLLLPIKSK